MKAGRISHEAQNFTQRGFHAEAQSSLRLTRRRKENTDISLRVFASGLRAGLAALREILFRSQPISRKGIQPVTPIHEINPATHHSMKILER